MRPPLVKMQGRLQGWQREQRDDLSLSEARHALWERRALVVGCMLLFLAIALLYVLSREPVYTAEATLSVRPEEGISDAENPDEVLARLRDSATSGLVEEAAERAGWEEEQSDFYERLEVKQVNDKEERVRFSAPTPEEAARAANAYAGVFVERAEELGGRLVGGTVDVDAEVEEVAVLPERRYDSRVFLVPIAAAGSGFLVGGVGALFLESRARRWHGSKDAELTLRAPVLGVIPDYSKDLSSKAFSRERGAT